MHIGFAEEINIMVHPRELVFSLRGEDGQSERWRLLILHDSDDPLRHVVVETAPQSRESLLRELRSILNKRLAWFHRGLRAGHSLPSRRLAEANPPTPVENIMTTELIDRIIHDLSEHGIADTYDY